MPNHKSVYETAKDEKATQQGTGVTAIITDSHTNIFISLMLNTSHNTRDTYVEFIHIIFIIVDKSKVSRTKTGKVYRGKKELHLIHSS